MTSDFYHPVPHQLLLKLSYSSSFDIAVVINVDGKLIFQKLKFSSLVRHRDSFMVGWTGHNVRLCYFVHFLVSYISVDSDFSFFYLLSVNAPYLYLLYVCLGSFQPIFCWRVIDLSFNFCS